MNLSAEQTGVAKGIAIGLLISLCLVLLSSHFFPFTASETSELNARLSTLGKAVLLPTITLTLAIGLVAKHRFFTPEDIEGGGLVKGTDKARLLQSLLQNTLEQFCVATGAYTAWCFVMPIKTLSVPLVCSIAFLFGRMLFFYSYKKGAAARALGFTLTFYPSVAMLLSITCFVLWEIASALAYAS